jgi:radical SAM superfamily enzyme YgiQ (UPF0313 family)
MNMQNKRILFFQPAVHSSKGTFFSAISNGLIALALFLEKYEYSVKICHFNHCLSIRQEVIEKLELFEPKVVGINLTWHTHIYQVIEIAKTVKKWDKNISVIIGGFTASYFDIEIYEYLKNDDLSNYPQIDFIIRGDSEEPLLDFIKTEKIPQFNTTIPINEGKLLRNPIKYIQKELPRIHFNKSPLNLIYNWEGYLSRGGIRTSVPSIEGKVGHNVSNGEFDLYIGKGCRNNCCYCGGSRQSHKLLSGRQGTVFRMVDDVLKDINILSRSGVKRLYIDFDPDPRREFYKQLFDKIQKIDLGLMFSAWSGPISTTLLDQMQNIFQEVEIVISPESGSEELRKQLIKLGYGKPPYYSNNELLDFFSELKKRNFKVMCYFMSGLPFETESDRDETKNLVSILSNNYRELFKKEYDPKIERNLCAPPLYIEPVSPIHLSPEKFNMLLTRKVMEDFLLNSKDLSLTPILGGKHERYNSEDIIILEAGEISEISKKDIDNV